MAATKETLKHVIFKCMTGVACLVCALAEPANDIPADAAGSCALSAAEYVLRSLDYSYDVQTLSSCLYASDGYSTAGTLVKAMQSHCLQVSARKGISPRNICKHIGESDRHYVIRCKPSPSPSIGHVQAIARAGSDVTVFDPATGLTPFSIQAFEESFATEEIKDDVFLLVSPVSVVKPGPRRDIEMEPSTIAFGEIATDDKLERAFVLRNLNKTPIAVTGIAAACGCMDVNLASGLISENGCVTGKVSIRGDLWGLSSQRKDVYFRFADGSFIVLPVLASIKSDSLISSPRTIIFGANPSMPQRHVIVEGLTLEETVGDWAVEADVPWLKVSYTSRGKNKRPFEGGSLCATVVCSISDNEWGDETAIRGLISFQSLNSARKVNIPVELTRENPFYSQPGYLYLKDGQKAYIIRIKQKRAGPMFRVAGVESPAFEIVYDKTWESDTVEVSATYMAGCEDALDGCINVTIEVEGQKEAAVLAIPVICRQN